MVNLFHSIKLLLLDIFNHLFGFSHDVQRCVALSEHFGYQREELELLCLVVYELCFSFDSADVSELASDY